MKFELSTALDVEGAQVPAYGFEHEGNFIVNAHASPCGRFHTAPSEYGITDEEGRELAKLNSGRNLMAYWDL